MAWIENRGKGRIFIRWRLHDGTVPAQGPYPNKAAAERALADIEKQHPPRKRRRKNGPLPGVALPWREVLDAWKATRVAERAVAATVASEVHRTLLRILGEGELEWSTPADATPTAIAAWVTRRQGVGTARPLSYLRAVYRWAGRAYGQPFDAATWEAMKPPPSREADVELMPDELVAGVVERAKAYGPSVACLFSCLATYGWREVTAGRLRVADVDLVAGTIRLQVKRRPQGVVHALTPEHVAQLRELVKDRAAAAPLFLRPHVPDGGLPGWIDKHGRANPLIMFYRHHLAPMRPKAEPPRPPGARKLRKDRKPPMEIDPRFGGVYALKRVAITRLNAAGVDLRTIADITGHKTVTQVARYLRTSVSRTREALAKLAAANSALPMHSSTPAATPPETHNPQP